MTDAKPRQPRKPRAPRPAKPAAEVHPNEDPATAERERVADQEAAKAREQLAASQEAAPPAEKPVRPAKDPRLCVLPGCDRAVLALGLCGAHWASRRGDHV